MASVKYNKGRAEFAKGNIDWENDTIKFAHLPASYTPNVDTDQYYSDISASVVGTDITLASLLVTQNNTDDAADCDTANTNETNQTITFDKMVAYKDTGVASTSVLITCNDITEGTLTPTDGDIDLTINVRGLFAI